MVILILKNILQNNYKNIMENKIKVHNAISLQKWIQINESIDSDKFILFGKNKEIQTDKQVLKKFHKLYTLIY
jgi:hypothetical protein